MENQEIKDSWEARVEDFSKIIGKSIQETEDMLNDEMLGLTKETPSVLRMLSDEEITPFGDLRQVFCNINKIPVPKLRMGIKYLRGEKEVKEQLTSSKLDPDLIDLQHKYGMQTTIEDLSIDSLIGYYNPLKVNIISEVLKSKYETKYGPFIAFIPDSEKVAIEETINYVADLEMGVLEPQAFIEVQGELVKLYGVNSWPQKATDEDPLYPGNALNQGRSTKNRVSWKNVPLETRQFYRLLFRRNKINREDRIAISNILSKDFKELKQIFPEAYLEFKELKDLNQLDSLKINLKINLNASTNRLNDPYNIRITNI